MKTKTISEVIRPPHLELMIICALFFIAVLSRFYGIWEWNLINDEIFTVSYAETRFNSLINPAYYNLVLIPFKLFGISEWTARLPSFLIGIISIPIFYICWRNVFGRNVAILASLFIVLSSWHLFYSQFARYYTGVFLFSSLSYYFYFQSISKNSYLHLTYMIVANVVSVLFHATSVLVPLSCAFCSLLFLVSNPCQTLEPSRRIAKVHLSIYAIAGILVMPFLFKILTEWQGKAQIWGDGPAITLLKIVLKFQLPIVLSAFFGFLLLLKNEKIVGLYFFICISIPVSIFLILSLFISTRPEYVFYISPLVYILSAYFCVEMVRNIQDKSLIYYGLPAMVLCLLGPSFVSHYTGKASLDIKDAVNFVDSNYREGDVIHSFSWSFKYYMSDRRTVNRRIAHPKAKNIKWNDKIASFWQGNNRQWFVVPVSFRSSDSELDKWLHKNSKLVWRDNETRLDHVVRGYEIYLIEQSEAKSLDKASQSEKVAVDLTVTKEDAM